MNLAKVTFLAVVCATLLFGAADAWDCSVHKGMDGTKCTTIDDCCSIVCTPSLSQGFSVCVGNFCQVRGHNGANCTKTDECCSDVCNFTSVSGRTVCIGD